MDGEKPDTAKEFFESKSRELGYTPYTTYTRNSLVKIRDAVRRLLARGCPVIIVTGGTGASKWDLSIEAVRPLTEKELPGIGDLHRVLSFQEGVSSAWASRVTGFVSGESLIFVIPGNPDALRVLFSIVGSKLDHVLKELAGEKVHSKRTR
jgi:molybdenum cofactor biosynthesis protein B